ncbi:MAG TPA: hypothetical protein PL174_02745 [Fervidobacterium sp.]|nr:hypothetical protein [Thermotogaceae bacterium]HOK34161.1 hypothetical protein [Fervidobacterium sp.]HOL03927.1 hypothetical protein [Fervidobacterium sp.]HON04383.1 hypothetical protein [Fervidobacterium sp.]HOP82113.1 hypothetical protein [Fervidobacterium sp.]
MIGNVKKNLLLTLAVLLIPLAVFGYFNFGAGYNYGDANSWMFRLGYEEDTFSFNADYLLNAGWYFTGDVTFDTQFGFGVGPLIYAKYSLATNQLTTKFGGIFDIDYQNFNVRLGIITDLSTSFNLSNSVYAKVRFYAPDPQGMKMKDKLYIEIGYYNPNFSIIVGLLEPF